MQGTIELTGNVASTAMMEGWHEGEPKAQWRVGFPLLSLDDSLVIQIETEPGASLGTHTDSAEEILLVLAGRIEAHVGDERVELGPGEMAIVPELAPHGFRTVGDVTARVLGFLSDEVRRERLRARDRAARGDEGQCSTAARGTRRARARLGRGVAENEDVVRCRGSHVAAPADGVPRDLGELLPQRSRAPTPQRPSRYAPDRLHPSSASSRSDRRSSCRGGLPP